VKPNNNLCNINRPEEVDQIPHIATSVEAALGFLSKSDEGMFLIYEQGDVSLSWLILPMRYNFVSDIPLLKLVSFDFLQID